MLFILFMVLVLFIFLQRKMKHQGQVLLIQVTEPDLVFGKPQENWMQQVKENSTLRSEFNRLGWTQLMPIFKTFLLKYRNVIEFVLTWFYGAFFLPLFLASSMDIIWCIKIFKMEKIPKIWTRKSEINGIPMIKVSFSK